MQRAALSLEGKKLVSREIFDTWDFSGKQQHLCEYSIKNYSKGDINLAVDS